MRKKKQEIVSCPPGAGLIVALGHLRNQGADEPPEPKVSTSKVAVSPMLIAAIGDLYAALFRESKNGDFAYTIAIRGKIVAASNYHEGIVNPKPRKERR